MISSILSGASAIGGLLSGSKSKSQPERRGWQTIGDLNERIKDFANEEIPDEIISTHRLPRPSLPYRQLTDAEMNDAGLFANPALQGLQRYKNFIAAQQAKEQPAEDDGTAAKIADALRGMQHLQRMQGMGNSVYGRIQQGAAPTFDQLSKIGGAIGEGGEVNTFNGQVTGGSGKGGLSKILAEIAYGSR